MDIYTGKIPEWIKDEDVQKLTASIRSEIISDALNEGLNGISGRLSISIFENLIGKYKKSNKLITQENIQKFIEKNKWFKDKIPVGFIQSLEKSYDYNTLQEVKSSAYFFNKKEISDKILNYLFALNFDFGEKKKSPYTKQTIEISEDYLSQFEIEILESDVTKIKRIQFRKQQQKEYIVQTLSREIKMENKTITDTTQFKNLFKKYSKKLKESSLKPLFSNSSFRRAISDYGTKEFNANDKKMKKIIEHMIQNLIEKYHYDKESSQQIILYLIDKKLQI